MAKRLLPSYGSMYVSPSKQLQLIGQSANQYLVLINNVHTSDNTSQINKYSSQSSNESKKVIYKKVQSPLNTHKKVSSMTYTNSKSFNLSNNLHNSLYTESKQQLATHSIQNQPTYLSDSLLGVNLSEETTSSTTTTTTNKVTNLVTKKNKSDQSESRERYNHLRFFYSDPEIDKAIEKPLIRLNPMSMMYMGVSDDKTHLIRSANYLRNQMPIR